MKLNVPTATSIKNAKKRRAKLLAEYTRRHKAAKGVAGIKSAMAVKHKMSAGRMWQLLNQARKENK